MFCHGTKLQFLWHDRAQFLRILPVEGTAFGRIERVRHARDKHPCEFSRGMSTTEGVLVCPRGRVSVVKGNTARALAVLYYIYRYVVVNLYTYDP